MRFVSSLFIGCALGLGHVNPDHDPLYFVEDDQPLDQFLSNIGDVWDEQTSNLEDDSLRLGRRVLIPYLPPPAAPIPISCTKVTVSASAFTVTEYASTSFVTTGSTEVITSTVSTCGVPSVSSSPLFDTTAFASMSSSEYTLSSTVYDISSEASSASITSSAYAAGSTVLTLQAISSGASLYFPTISEISSGTEASYWASASESASAQTTGYPSSSPVTSGYISSTIIAAQAISSSAFSSFAASSEIVSSTTVYSESSASASASLLTLSAIPSSSLSSGHLSSTVFVIQPITSSAVSTFAAANSQVLGISSSSITTIDVTSSAMPSSTINSITLDSPPSSSSSYVSSKVFAIQAISSSIAPVGVESQRETSSQVTITLSSAATQASSSASHAPPSTCNQLIVNGDFETAGPNSDYPPWRGEPHSGIGGYDGVVMKISESLTLSQFVNFVSGQHYKLSYLSLEYEAGSNSASDSCIITTMVELDAVDTFSKSASQWGNQNGCVLEETMAQCWSQRESAPFISTISGSGSLMFHLVCTGSSTASMLIDNVKLIALDSTCDNPTAPVNTAVCSRTYSDPGLFQNPSFEILDPTYNHYADKWGYNEVTGVVTSVISNGMSSTVAEDGDKFFRMSSNGVPENPALLFQTVPVVLGQHYQVELYAIESDGPIAGASDDEICIFTVSLEGTRSLNPILLYQSTKAADWGNRNPACTAGTSDCWHKYTAQFSAPLTGSIIVELKLDCVSSSPLALLLDNISLKPSSACPGDSCSVQVTAGIANPITYDHIFSGENVGVPALTLDTNLGIDRSRILPGPYTSTTDICVIIQDCLELGADGDSPHVAIKQDGENWFCYMYFAGHYASEYTEPYPGLVYVYSQDMYGIRRIVDERISSFMR